MFQGTHVVGGSAVSWHSYQAYPSASITYMPYSRADGVFLCCSAQHLAPLHAPFCAVKREQERGREESDLPSMCAFAKLRGPTNFQN
jgi:hypothetical protein